MFAVRNKYMRIQQKVYILSIFISLISYQAKSQQEGSIGIGTTSPDAKAILDVSARDKGVLVPRLSQTERNALQQPTQDNLIINGMLIYNTTTHKFNYWNGNDWKIIDPSGATSGSTWYAGATPNTSTLIEGDFYLNNDGNYYQRQLNIWVYKGNLKGPQEARRNYRVEMQPPDLVIPANGSTTRVFQVTGVNAKDAVYVSTSPYSSAYFNFISIANVVVTGNNIVTVTFANNSGNEIRILPGIAFTFGVIP